MKYLALTLCVAVSAVALSACESTGTTNTEASVPYKVDRTAGGEVEVERTFRRVQSK